MTPPRAPRRRWLLVLLCVWVVSGVYMAANIKRGWVPHDEGALAQSAERVLRGELPHRDFVDIYTGGLSYLHALAFRLLGVNFGSLRIVLFLFFLAWVPAVYYIAAQLVTDWAAAGVTLLAVVWSVPTYAAAVPSWYNLFFATFGTAAICRYLTRPAAGWLVLAGVCGGLSFLAKNVALYYVGAVILFFALHEQDAATPSPAPTERLHSVLVAVLALSLVSALVVLTRDRTSGPVLVHFVLPGASLVALLLWRERTGRFGGSRQRLTALLRMVLPFGAGVLLPLALFLAPYVSSGSVSDLVDGVFRLPQKRVASAFMRPPALHTMTPLLVIAALVAGAHLVRGRLRWFLGVAVLAFLAARLWGAVQRPDVYLWTWRTAQSVVPLVTVLGVARLHLGARSVPSPARERLLLLLSMTALCSLVQFPFAAPIYFCYMAPLAILACAALLATLANPPRPLLLALGAYYVAVAVFVLTPGFVFDFGWRYSPDRQTARLTLPRAGGLRVAAETAELYEQLIPFVQQRAANGEILAAPDCPEVYFLAGYTNPTRTLVDFFEEPVGYKERIGRLLETRPITVAVVNRRPSFSVAFAEPVREAVAERFSAAREIGPFEVRWRP